MSFRSRLLKVVKYGAGTCGVVVGGVVSYHSVDWDRLRENGLASSLSRLSVSAKTKEPQQPRINELYHGSGAKWDSNWDKREPSSLVKPLKENATDEEKAAYEEKISANTSKANRILVLVRHGQYNLGGKTDEERFLTETGRQQADITGHRLALLYSKYLQKVDSNGNEVTDKSNFQLVKSTMTRATETANIILKHLPEDIQQGSCDLIREGPPCPPDPPSSEWTPDPSEFYQEGARIEAAFRKYFHRAEPSQEKTSVEVLVCHGNVIRYFVCRALQFDPRGWLRMAVHNGSITVLVIKPSGRVSLLELGGAGHFPPEMLTFN